MQVTCSCGAVHTVGSTLDELKVEICSHCHPFYTGKSKLVDTEGRVDKFRRRQEEAAAAAAEKAAENKEEAPAEEEKAAE